MSFLPLVIKTCHTHTERWISYNGILVSANLLCKQTYKGKTGEFASADSEELKKSSTLPWPGVRPKQAAFSFSFIG